MNWLAHLFLSQQQIDFQMGNILADPLKGRLWNDASINMQKGMEVHKIIDSYSDSHPLVQKSKSTLRKNGLLRAVIVDLTYDYFLTKNWDRYSNISLEKFTNEFYEKVKKRSRFLPLKAQSFMNNLVQADVLNKYQNLHKLQIGFERLDMRLSKRLLKRETASGYFNEVYKNIDDLENDFLSFFPELCSHTKKNLEHSTLSHWKL